MEKGKVEINAWTIVYLADTLNKPITYFYPKENLDNDPREEELTDLEKELINNFRSVPYEGQRKLAIQLIKNLGKYHPGWDTADNLIKDSKNPEFAAELFFNMYLKDLVEDDKKEEK
jgi:hypothetical protein